MKCQLANSPDLKKLDLGSLRIIQSIQHEQSLRNIDQLIDVVDYAHDMLDPKNQLCLNEIINIMQLEETITSFHIWLREN